MKVCVIDSRLIRETTGVFGKNGITLIGGKGLTLRRAKKLIMKHFNENENRYDAIIYKLCLGINDITSVKEWDFEGARDIYIKNETSLASVKNNLDRVYSLMDDNPRLYVTTCHIQGASLPMCAEHHRLIQGYYMSYVTESMQSKLERIIIYINLYITQKNRTCQIADYAGSRNFGDVINCGKLIDNGVKVWGTRYYRMADGIHLHENWKSKSAKLAVKAILREAENLKCDLQRRWIHS